MIKQIIITITVLAFVLAVGITETVVVNKCFDEFQTQIETVSQQAYDETITVEQITQLNDDWIKLREKMEFLITHLDTTEMDLILSEAVGYVRVKEPKLAYVNLVVALELAHHIPHSGMPSLEHIV